MVYRTGMKLQAFRTMPRVKTNKTDKKKLDEENPMLAIRTTVSNTYETNHQQGV